ncbi:MAG: O-antigen ligase family protein [Gilvibacter sp.]
MNKRAKSITTPLKKVTYLQLLLLHIGMGVLVYLFKSASFLLMIGIFVAFLTYIVAKNNRGNVVLIAAAYFTGAEVFFRMTGAALFYETGKYAVIFFLLLGMLYRGTSLKSIPFWVYLFILVPGIVFSAINLNYETNVRTAIVFNLSGPFCLGIAAIYMYYRKVSFERLQQIILAILLPIITTMVYLYLYTPDIKDALSGTQSNFMTSGGFGPNQVATILGLGMFILLSRLFTIKSRMINAIDLVLLLFMSYRAIVTFSRGGVVTAGICAAFFIIAFFMLSKPKIKAQIIPKITLIVFGLIITWAFTSMQTTGLIDKRYTNRDAAGRLKKDITTGRSELISNELLAFYEEPLTGIGVGKIKEFRFERTGTLAATHNEVSRLLSEHGIFGLLALLLLFFIPVVYWFKQWHNPFLPALFLFWFLTINHSSMRLAAPAFIYGLMLLYVEKEVRAKKSSNSTNQIES